MITKFFKTYWFILMIIGLIVSPFIYGFFKNRKIEKLYKAGNKTVALVYAKVAIGRTAARTSKYLIILLLIVVTILL